MFDLPPHRHNHLTVSDSLPLHPVPPHVSVWECSSHHFELNRSVGDCLYAAIFLAGLTTETMKLASMHRCDAVNTLRHSVTSSYASKEERTKDCHDANQQKHTCTRAQEGQIKTGHTALREQRTLKNRSYRTGLQN